MRYKKLRNPRASHIRHNKHKTNMTSPTNYYNPHAGRYQAFKVGKYKSKFFTIYKGNTEIPFFLEFIVVKRTDKCAVFLIDGKEYRRKIHMVEQPELAYCNIPDPYKYNDDGEIIGRLDKPFDRTIDWIKTRNN